MASKNKEVRMEQLRVFEKKLALRIQQLEQKGMAKEKAQVDPIVKRLKSKIKQTKTRMSAVDKFVQKGEELARAKAEKLAALAAKKEEKPETAPEEAASENIQDEVKPKKKAARDTSKPAADEAAPKKAKKQADAAGEETAKKKAPKKKEE
jgi:hypothetical protein